MPTEDYTYRVIITGYGPFMNIKENPSAEVVKCVVNQFEDYFGPSSKVELFYNTVIDVEKDKVDIVIEEIKTKIDQNKEKNPRDRYLVLHLGVSGGQAEDELNLETRCFNAKCFVD
jgi:pyrrolidone-carboxylate peptidase